ncbi:glycosyltransferase family 4 protein [Parathermosynechococcus lividus]
MTRMKVLHIITGLSNGGAEAVLFRLVTHDAQNQHVVVSLTGEGKYGPLLRAMGVDVVTLDMPRRRLTWRGLRGLWLVLRRLRPDVVQTWMYHADLVGGIAARAAGIPVVWGIRNTTLELGRSSRATIWVARACARLSRHVPARIVACAQAARAVHAELGYDAQRMVVIPNGYDLGHFVPDSAARQRLRTDWGVADDVALIGMVARFHPQKDHANLIDALALLTQRGLRYAAVLVGTGMTPDNAELTQRISAAGLAERVRLLGVRPDVPAIMSALDVHVLSSASGEAFPNVLAEAMACGTPCVTTDVGDAATIVGDTGWVVPPRNPEALADALQAALTAWRDHTAWRARQRACRERIQENFGIEAMVARYRYVWQEAGISLMIRL